MSEILGVLADKTSQVQRVDTAPGYIEPAKRRIALFTSVDSFEGFYGGTFGLSRETYLSSYRNDFVWDYANGLATRGHEVVIYILSYGPGLLREIGPGISVRFVRISNWLRLVDPLLWRMSQRAPSSTLRTTVSARAYGATLLKCLAEDRIDVLYHQEIWTPRFDAMVDLVDIPVVGAEHGAVFEMWMEPAKRKSLPRASKLVCQTTSNLGFAEAFGGDAVMLTNAVDSEFFAPAAGPRTQSILAVGRLVESQKRFSDLFRAVAKLPAFSLTLVGTGPDETMLRRLADELGIADRVMFAGFVSDRARLRSLYQGCGVFACPSSWEAVALVVLEAMSCAAPVVVTRIPSFEELVANDVNGVLIEVGAVDALANAIKHAWEHRDRLGREAREVVTRRYSSSRMFDSLASLLGAIPGRNA